MSQIFIIDLYLRISCIDLNIVNIKLYKYITKYIEYYILQIYIIIYNVIIYIQNTYYILNIYYKNFYRQQI